MSTDTDTEGQVIQFPDKNTDGNSEKYPVKAAEQEVVDAEFVDEESTTALAVDQPHTVIDVLPWQQPDERRPIISPIFTKEHRDAALRWYLGGAFHRTRYHTARLPWYQAKTLTYAPRGAVRIGRHVAGWVNHAETQELKRMAVRHAVDKNLHDGHAIYHQAERVAAPKIRARRIVLAVMATVFILGMAALWLVTPAWVPVLVALGVVDALGYAGRPMDKPFVGAAVVSEQYVKLTSNMVIRALSSSGIAALSAKDAVITFPSPIQRDGDGWRADVDLPHGTTAAEVMKVRPKLASGLRRPLGCVWPEGASDIGEHRLVMWVGDKDLAKKGHVRWPLVNTGRHDFFERAPFGVDPRGRPITMPLFQHNILMGSLPGQGKTNAVLCLACGQALDPTVELWVHDLGKGDLDPLECISHRFTSGVDDESIAYAAKSLRLLRAEVERRATNIKKLPKDMCPDGKRISREIADRRSFRMWPIVCILDECFPAGTLVGGRAIETLRIGDVVPSWNETTGESCNGTVSSLFTKAPTALVRIHWQDGETLVCTPNHPLMTTNGWQGAGTLDTSSEVLSYGQARATRNSSVFDLSEVLCATDREETILEENWARLVLPGVHTCGVAFTERDIPLQAGSESGPIASDAGTQPDARPGRTCRCGGLIESHGTQADSAGWQWTRSDGAATHTGRGAGVGYGDSSSYRAAGKRHTDALQSGHSRPILDGGDRSGRRLTLHAGTPSAGRAEDGVAYWRRVDRVEVLEPGSDGRYGGLCPDGLVYNIEVAGTHTYRVADGVVAHNCQNLYGHKDYGKQAGEDSEFIIRLGRALGVVLILATQRPDKDALPTGVSGNVSIRFCLYVAGQVENDMILGTSSYQNGLRATAPNLRPEIDAGIGILKGASPVPVNVKVAYFNQRTIERVIARARAMREKAGTLSGVAIGETDDSGVEIASFLDDLTVVFAQAERTDRQGVWSMELCAKLMELRPDIYHGWDPDALAAACKPYALRTAQLHMPDETGARRTRYGLRREQIEHALAERAERRKLELQ